MNTDFQAFLDAEETAAFLRTMLDEATQFSVAKIGGEWVVSWPVRSRMCPDQCKAFAED